MKKVELYRLLKGIFRIQTGFASVRVWFLNKTHPKGTNIHLFDLINRIRSGRR